jgi:[ribosomal protein S18]-alanine N-acetyltransferase
MPLTIRRASIADLYALLALENSFSGDQLRREHFRHLLTRARADVWLRVVADELLGNAIVLYRAGSRRARLYSLVVAPSARGRGIARSLMETAKQAAAARGCRTMTLEVRCDNVPAINLYRKLGYRFIERLPRYYEDGQDGFRLECSFDTPAVPPRIAA